MSHNTHNPENGPNRASEVIPGETPDTAGWAEKFNTSSHPNNGPTPAYTPYKTNDEYSDRDLDPGIQHPTTRLNGVK